ncbi:MAG: hypothetical protein K2X95_11845 [Flavobacteriaceae bacterium]|nr:hypothetical protein [Flavobacteriaceae bacterium]
MKTTKTFLASLFILLSITTISAQYGNNGYGGGGYGGNGYGGNGYGSGNGMNQMGGMNQRSEPEKPKEIPAEVTVAKVMEDMKPALGLDELQVIAISNVLIESINTQGRILKQDSTQDEQMKDFQALSENTDRKIMNFLNKDQKEKYLAFKEDRKNPKKSKSKEKKK